MELVDDDGAQELQAEGESEGGQSLDSQAGGGAAVELRHLRGHLQIFYTETQGNCRVFLVANSNSSFNSHWSLTHLVTSHFNVHMRQYDSDMSVLAQAHSHLEVFRPCFKCIIFYWG